MPKRGSINFCPDLFTGDCTTHAGHCAAEPDTIGGVILVEEPACAGTQPIGTVFPVAALYKP